MRVLKRIGLQALALFLVALGILGMWHVHGVKVDMPLSDREATPMPYGKEERVDEYRSRPLRL